MVSASFYSSCNAARYPRIRSFFLSGKLRKPSRIIFSSVFAAHISRSTAFRSISFSPKSSYGVTFSTSQIFSILSADGFVPFLFQSLMVLCEIPVSSENSFWVTPFRRINCISPFHSHFVLLYHKIPCPSLPPMLKKRLFLPCADSVFSSCDLTKKEMVMPGKRCAMQKNSLSSRFYTETQTVFMRSVPLPLPD